MMPSERKRSELLDVEQRWTEAHRTLDLETIEAILADDYRQIKPDGTVIGKDELVASYRSGERRWEIAHSDQLEIYIQDKLAWMIGRWRGKGVNQGEPFDYQARFLAVYRMEAGDWKLTADMSTPIKPNP